MIKHLTADGLITSERRGHALTLKGTENVVGILRRISKPQEVDLGGVVSGRQSLIIAYSSSTQIDSAVGLRDTALKAGADGAMLLEYDGEKLIFPGHGMAFSEYPHAAAALQKLKLARGDVVIVSFSSSQKLAEDGALALAIRLTHMENFSAAL